MLRWSVLLFALGVAMPARSADTKPAGGTATASKSKAKAPTKEQSLAVTNAKAGFMAAVRACAKPETCDPNSSSVNRDLVDLLDRKESGFMDACMACAEREPCEKERDRIRDGGGGQQGRHPCTPKSK